VTPRVESIDLHPGFVPLLVDAFAREWPDWCARAGAIEDRARKLGYPMLYAATNRIERLLTRSGWQVYRRVDHDGAPMAWLQKIIGVRLQFS
jgi:hypothetical protein